MKEVIFETAAQRQLRKLSPAVRAQIMSRLERYAQSGLGDVKRLNGRPGLRLRSGAFRVIFIEEESRLLVRAVADRKEIYD